MNCQPPKELITYIPNFKDMQNVNIEEEKVNTEVGVDSEPLLINRSAHSYHHHSKQPKANIMRANLPRNLPIEKSIRTDTID